MNDRDRRGKGPRRAHGGKGDGGRAPQHPGKRLPPPDATGAEAAYLAKNKEAKTTMVVQLLDGETVRGWIEYYDRDMIKINRDAGPNLFIRKSTIRYLYKDPGPSAS